MGTKKSIFVFLITLLLWQSVNAYADVLSPDSVTVSDNDNDNIAAKQRGHIANSLEVLSGTTAGVTIGGNANSEEMLTSVRIRGNSSLTGGNEPLVIIDGMSSDLRTMASIYPADIEKINILKDITQTATYGSRGSAGVIEVTTKRGTKGKFNFAYSFDVGFAHADKTQSMLSASEYRRLTSVLGLTIVDGGAHTDWQHEILRTGFVQNHHVSFSGGSDATQYRASISYSMNNSVVRTIGNQNLTTKLDVTQKALANRLTIDFGLFGSSQQNKYINNEQKLFYSAAAFNPTIEAGKTPTGSWRGYADASQLSNPQSLLDILIHNKALHFNTHLRLSALLCQGLTLSIYGTYGYSVHNDSHFFPTYLESTGKIYRGESQDKLWLANAQLTYAHTWRDSNGKAQHKLSAMLLAEMQGLSSTGFHTTAGMLASNAYSYNNLAVGAVRLWNGTGSSAESQQLLSFLLSASYTALDKYSLSLTARTDASSVVSANHRWGVFPSVSVTWNMKNESVLKEVGWLSSLNIKAGYGLTGNLGGLAAYRSMSLLEPMALVDNNGLPQVVLGIKRNANDDLRWETKQTVDVGADFGIFNKRFIMQIDYYYSRVSNMLYNYTVSVPPFPYNSMFANLGKMVNQGVEVGVAIVAVRQKDFDFNINLNVAYQYNKLLSLDGWYKDNFLTAPEFTPIAGLNGAGLHGGDSYVTYQIVGQPLGVFYLPHCIGLETQADGTRRYVIEDLDGNGVVDISDGADRKVCGQATPKVLLGSNFSFRWRDLDISLQINGAFGHKIYNGSALSYNNLGSLPYYNVATTASKLYINDMTVTDYWLERGDYVNIDYLTIGYNIPLKPQTRVSRLRVSASVNNLATISAYSGLTPIINSSVINSTLGVDDKNSYPVSRTYSVALLLQF